MICDICSKPGRFKEVTSDAVRQAVQEGFNPFDLGLIAIDPTQEMLGMTKEKLFINWKNNTVAPDTTNWNICPVCYGNMEKNLNPQSGIMGLWKKLFGKKS